jgi:serine/threonine-protein kinase
MATELFANRYRLLEPLGRGSMSAVWLAEDTELGRRVAVKTLGPAADRQRFTREARAVAAVAHPNICALYDYGETDGRPFMVLEYLPNGSLEELLTSGKPLPDEDTARIAADVAGGLAHAHARGLVHRDLKPANILFDGEGRAKIADFGIARMGGTGTLTEAGTVLGTASYISPEQAAGEPAGPASDVYSFGVVLFRMLTGRLPFVGHNAMEVVRMHRDDPPPTVAELRPDAPPTLAALADHSLAKSPEARPADGAALVATLRGEGDAGRTLIAETEATRVLPPRQGPARRRALVAIAVAAATLLSGGIVLAYALTRETGDGSSPPPTTTALTIPTVSTEQSTTAPTTTAEPTTTREQTTAPTTTAETTTAPTTTAVPTTVPTLPTTTAPLPTTTVLPTTTTAPETTTPETTTISVP